MKKSKKDDSVAKAFQERYARVLGLEPFSSAETPAKSSLRRYVFLLMLLALTAIGAWFFFRPPAAGTAPSAASTSSPNLQLPPAELTNPGLPAQSDAGQGGPEVPEPVAPVHVVEEAASFGKSNAAPNPQSLSEPPPPNNAESTPKEAPGPSWVVLLSTKSKEDAIERARELGNSGTPCEVILSSSGYYGVVLRRDTYEQAQAAMKAIIAAGRVKTAPYIMSAERVKEHIYPEVQ
jgi:hypothetical protein